MAATVAPSERVPQHSFELNCLALIKQVPHETRIHVTTTRVNSWTRVGAWPVRSEPAPPPPLAPPFSSPFPSLPAPPDSGKRRRRRGGALSQPAVFSGGSSEGAPAGSPPEGGRHQRHLPVRTRSSRASPTAHLGFPCARVTLLKSRFGAITIKTTDFSINVAAG